MDTKQLQQLKEQKQNQREILAHCTVLQELVNELQESATRSPMCNADLTDCYHILKLLTGTLRDLKTKLKIGASRPSTAIDACPSCAGRLQNISGDVYFCLDCEWDNLARLGS